MHIAVFRGQFIITQRFSSFFFLIMSKSKFVGLCNPCGIKRMEVAEQGREAERGCSEETGRLQTDIRCSSSICHVSVRSGSRRAACILLCCSYLIGDVFLDN